MKMNVQVTSRQAIKPVNPTPSHLRRVELSFIDQINNPNFVPYIFFYHHQPNTTFQTISHTLKQSLGQLLTKFYPLAGRLRNNRYIDCNDDGVHYFEARCSNLRLSQLLQRPNDFDLNVLLPYDQLHDAGDLLLAIQVTSFDCGEGFAVAAIFSHKIADALSMMLFVKWWGDTARGAAGTVDCPVFDLAKTFPPIDMSSSQHNNNNTERNGIHKDTRFVSKSFFFSDSSISAVKSRHPAAVSRVEALTSFLWARSVAAIDGANKVYTVVQAVNLRPRINNVDGSKFGNLSWFSTKTLVANNDKGVGERGTDLVMALREAVKKMDGDYAKRFQGRFDLFRTKPSGDDDKKPSYVGHGDPYTFSSLIRMPIYEADFGWGKPVWVTIPTQPLLNFVALLPTASGEGVEARINMRQDCLAKLEADRDFLAFTTTTNIASCSL